MAISDDGRPVMNARVMRRAMEFARSYDLPVIDHCEDLNLSAGGDMHEGARSVRWGLRGIPAASEDVMVARDLLLARADRRALSRGPHLDAQRRGHGGITRKPQRPAGHLRSHAASFRARRRGHGALRQQLQNEAAAALARATAPRWWRASSPAPSTPSPPTTRRTPAAKRCRNSSAARSASSVSKPRWAWRSNGWCIRARSR